MSFGTRTRDILSTIQDIVLKTTRYYRHYIAMVVDTNDPLRKNRVKVRVDQLGWDSASKGCWCWPRQGHSASVPKYGEWVEIWFINADPSWPVYLGIASEMKDMVVGDGSTTKHILFTPSVDSSETVEYDETTGVLALLGKGKSFVTWDELNTMLATLQTNLNAHVHQVVSLGAPTLPTPTSTPPITFSTDISGAKTTKVKTDG